MKERVYSKTKYTLYHIPRWNPCCPAYPHMIPRYPTLSHVIPRYPTLPHVIPTLSHMPHNTPRCPTYPTLRSSLVARPPVGDIIPRLEITHSNISYSAATNSPHLLLYSTKSRVAILAIGSYCNYCWQMSL